MKNCVYHQTMPRRRQTLMFSATFPRQVQGLAREFLNNYLFLQVGIVGMFWLHCRRFSHISVTCWLQVEPARMWDRPSTMSRRWTEWRGTRSWWRCSKSKWRSKEKIRRWFSLNRRSTQMSSRCSCAKKKSPPRLFMVTIPYLIISLFHLCWHCCTSGDRAQEEREQALEDFKSGRKPILVATAVAARGLDINNVTHVINFSMPKEVEEYVHR